MDNKNSLTHIFIDFSNIYIGFINYTENKYKILNAKINCEKLLKIIEKDNNVEKRVLIGSEKANIKYKNYEKHIQKIFMKYGYIVTILKRYKKEYGVDELLHEKIEETLNSELPGTIIIGSGDGKVANDNNSFYNLTINALYKGWNVVIISWKYQLSRNYSNGEELYELLKDEEVKKRFTQISLEKYIDELIL